MYDKKNTSYMFRTNRPVKVADWRKYAKRKSQSLPYQRNPNDQNFQSELPKSTWVLHSGDTHVTNNRNVLISSTKCDEHLYNLSGGRMEAKAIGDVHLKLANNLMLDLQRVRFAPDAKCNLISEGALRVDMGFAIEFGEQKTHLRFKDKSGAESRFELAETVAGKFCVLTDEPAIENVIEYAAAHPLWSNQSKSISLFTQASGVGQCFKRLEALNRRC